VGCSVGIELDEWTLEEYVPLREELEGILKRKGLPRPPDNVFLFPGDSRDEKVHGTIRRQTGLAFHRFDLFYSFQPLQQELAERISRLARPGAVWIVYGVGDILPRFPGLTLRTQDKALEGILALYRKP
jgi:hypothetical protein